MKKILVVFLSVLALGSLVFGSAPTINAKAETESAINVYSVTSGLLASPSVVYEYKEGDDISELAQKASSKLVRPATMIVEPDENFSVTAGGETLSYNDFRVKYIKSKMLPAVRVESDGAAQSLIDYLSASGYDFIDFAVVSTNPSLVKKVREARPSIRGIIDYSKADIDDKTAGQIANEANENKALTVILNYSQAKDKTFGIQAMTKSVWVKQSESGEYGVLKAVSTGALGIITDNYKEAYDAFSSVEELTLSRGFYNIGHRGLCISAGENTLEAMIAAYEAGATHFEIDAKVCKSGEIVIMHDDGISTSTNGSGTVSEMTLAELRRYKVVKGLNGAVTEPCDIPTLEEVFNYFKDKDAVIVVEIKNAQKEYPAKFAELVKKCGVADKVVSIGFGLSEIRAVGDAAPEIPLANLNGTNKNDFLIYMAQVNALNASADPAKSNLMSDSWMFKNTMARGYLPYCWTFTTENEAQGGVYRGVAGITTDRADGLSDFAKSVLTEKIEIQSEEELLSAHTVKVKTYCGKEEERTAKVLSYSETGENEYSAIMTYEDKDVMRLTGEIKLTVKKSSPSESGDKPSESGNTGDGSSSSPGSSESGKKGCSGDLTAASLSFAVLLSAMLIVKGKVKN